ncbi:hypothetical protein EDB85DRAFT_1274012 [Lactarius pseudohatsudake]|nr:hypothetical protein EDB85DRAFT_1274012 [Lactarius pseudohatsudake]
MTANGLGSAVLTIKINVFCTGTKTENNRQIVVRQPDASVQPHFLPLLSRTCPTHLEKQIEDALTSRNYRTETANGSAQNHESVPTEKPLDTERTLTLAGFVGAQSDSLSDPETPVAATAGHAFWRRHRSLRLAHHHWMVQSLAASTSILHPRRRHCPSRRWGAVDERTCVRSRAPPTCGPSPCSLVRTRGRKRAAQECISRPRRSATLDALQQTLYLLFCVSVHGHAWRVGNGDALGLGDCAGRIYAVCVPQVGGSCSRVRIFRVLICSSSIHRFVRVQR